MSKDPIATNVPLISTEYFGSFRIIWKRARNFINWLPFYPLFSLLFFCELLFQDPKCSKMTVLDNLLCYHKESNEWFSYRVYIRHLNLSRPKLQKKAKITFQYNSNFPKLLDASQAAICKSTKFYAHKISDICPNNKGYSGYTTNFPSLSQSCFRQPPTTRLLALLNHRLSFASRRAFDYSASPRSFFLFLHLLKVHDFFLPTIKNHTHFIYSSC